MGKKIIIENDTDYNFLGLALYIFLIVDRQRKILYKFHRSHLVVAYLNQEAIFLRAGVNKFHPRKKFNKGRH